MTTIAPPAPKTSSRRDSWSRRAPLLPALIITLLLTQVPFVMTIWYSLQNWNLLNPGRRSFAGLDNYQQTFTDSVFWQSLGNTAVLTVGATVASMVVGLVLAVLLQKKFPGRGIARTLAITPFFVMPVAAALFWRSAIFDPSFGLLGWLTDAVGLPRVNWLSEQSMLSIIMISSWRWTPFAMLVLLAGLQALPEDQLEAARVDGATWWQQFRGVMLPHLRPFLELTALLLSMNLIQTFGEIALLTAGGPAFGTTNITYYVYLRAFQSFDYGLASAYGLVALVLTIALALPALRLLSGIFQQEGRR
ncbi:sugar ABC transporter permease [Paractinoplanes abujensis]|uniref:Sorbitol/mannitol transport system permease protein n=1 Tax=Paractinoplanes abujensis TaxID=882441 RepID=A0A7W7G240_9ACTN|nr:sugar ABC transporter permease [Actinoplanes abujensis]MBB4693367.1 sorbitol/mannitol transport system permease protein [Actinoplanes abujensis]GID24571.1 sugar ABC transporter permease [Actinoplanes abujensis]